MENDPTPLPERLVPCIESEGMTVDEFYIMYPEGESQELETSLRIDELVDLNGHRLALPLPSPRVIAYRVTKIRHTEERGIHAVLHYVELVPALELASYCL
jgi:hypothetical protein